jgi:DEAD/DEAH box helicase domain-containing protein
MNRTNKVKGFIYDCEIIKCIPPAEDDDDHEYLYCDGWHDFQNMGISVIGTCDLESGELKAFIDRFCIDDSLAHYSPLSEFDRLVKENRKSSGTIVGFNSENFDDLLCRANGIKIKSDYDLLRLIRQSAYESPNWDEQPRGYTYSLNAITRANGFAKSGHGALAPKLWQQGKHEEVIDYCLNDCKITWEIWKKYVSGELIDPNTGKKLKPVELTLE